ncbi:hypothetical protein HSR122_1253 [Halapricum desulfuricans]|uniref:Uncharacterized protein n=1 Tax=Halapricum desulfuricans TaxID=2841257 RepID=A0A897N878_9EURY|nr:hypothetical protein HSR122_1253 [Halapricum desulfuricans]
MVVRHCCVLLVSVIDRVRCRLRLASPFQIGRAVRVTHRSFQTVGT